VLGLGVLGGARDAALFDLQGPLCINLDPGRLASFAGVCILSGSNESSNDHPCATPSQRRPGPRARGMGLTERASARATVSGTLLDRRIE
jgi:hypothetical protein